MGAITDNWRKYSSDYDILEGEGFIAPFTNPSYLIDGCPTEAFVGIDTCNGSKYISSIGEIWENNQEESRQEEDNHGAIFYHFDYWGALLGGEENRGKNQFPTESVRLEDRIKIIKIAADLMVAQPDLTQLAHAVITNL